MKIDVTGESSTKGQHNLHYAIILIIQYYITSVVDILVCVATTTRNQR